jgi:hypothetical protein
MDIALLSANANQLRHAVELSPPFRYLYNFFTVNYLCLNMILKIFPIYKAIISEGLTKYVFLKTRSMIRKGKKTFYQTL